MNTPLPFVSRGAKAWGMARHHSPPHPLFRQRWFFEAWLVIFGFVPCESERIPSRRCRSISGTNCSQCDSWTYDPPRWPSTVDSENQQRTWWFRTWTHPL